MSILIFFLFFTKLLMHVAFEKHAKRRFFRSSTELYSSPWGLHLITFSWRANSFGIFCMLESFVCNKSGASTAFAAGKN